MSSILNSRIRTPHVPTSCPKPSCKQDIEFVLPSPAPKSGTILQIRCCNCQTVFDYAYYSNGSASTGDSSKKARMIGTQERPLETEYYELLGVSINATTEDIKRAYRRLAIQHHPDKNPNDPSAQARFQAISSAYQVLSDPVLRKKYNEFGASKDVATTVMDPEEVFGQIFGGEKFEDIFGKISLAKDMKTALQEAEDAEDGDSNKISNGKGLGEDERKKKEEKARKKATEKSAQRTERISKLVANLSRKLAVFTESATGPNDAEITRSFRTICEIEAESLSHESYGPALLHTIGLTYTFKAKTFLASSSSATTILGLPTFGVGGWIKNVQGKWDTFSDTVSTLRAALDLKSTFEAIQAAEKNGNLTPEQRKKLEEQAAEKGLDALFKGTKLEIQSILRETCDIVLASPSPSNASVPATPQQANLRAFALNILGEAYLKWGNPHVDHKDPSSNTNTRADNSDSDYVRVDRKNGR